MDTKENTEGQGSSNGGNPPQVEGAIQKTPTYEAFKNPKVAEMLLAKMYNFTGYGDFKKAYAVQRFCKKAFSALKEYPLLVKPYFEEKQAIINNKEMTNEQKEEASKTIIDKLETEVWNKELDLKPWTIKTEDVRPILNQLSPAEIESLDNLTVDSLN